MAQKSRATKRYLMHCYTRRLIAAAAAAVCAIAYAASTVPANDALAKPSAAIALTQAVTIAEQHVKGKATQAEFEQSKHGPVYTVEVASGEKVFDITVDAVKGTVISSAEDKTDHDDDRD